VTSPLISCIVPVFNGERYLAETLDSILAQTYRPIEVIAVDDGSTDGTGQVIAGYGDRVRCLRQANAGPTAARNFGLTAATGALVAFVDSDDLWHPEKLERQVARFLARPDLDVCVSHVRNFWVEEIREEAARFERDRLGTPMPGYCNPTLLAKRALFERVGQFDPELDRRSQADWFIRARAHGANIELLPDVLVYRRVHRMNLSRRLHGQIRDDCLVIAKRLIDRRRQGVPAAPDALSQVAGVGTAG
jgi:glycosyltransferase involved in cell wall biosynthesis